MQLIVQKIYWTTIIQLSAIAHIKIEATSIISQNIHCSLYRNINNIWATNAGIVDRESINGWVSFVIYRYFHKHNIPTNVNTLIQTINAKQNNRSSYSTTIQKYNEIIEVIKKQSIDSSYQEQDIVYTVLIYCSTCKQAIDLRVVLFYFLIIK